MQVQVIVMIGNEIVVNETIGNIKTVRGAVITANRMTRTYDFIENDGNLVSAMATDGSRTVYIETLSWNSVKSIRVRTYFDARKGVHSYCYEEDEKN